MRQSHDNRTPLLAAFPRAGGVCRAAPHGQCSLTVAWLLARVALLVGVLLLVPRLLLGCALLVPRLLLAVLRVPCRVEETQVMSAVCQRLSRSLTFPTSDFQSRKLALDTEATPSWKLTAPPLSGVRAAGTHPRNNCEYLPPNPHLERHLVARGRRVSAAGMGRRYSSACRLPSRLPLGSPWCQGLRSLASWFPDPPHCFPDLWSISRSIRVGGLG